MTPASFLATRTIQELADLEENNFPTKSHKETFIWMTYNGGRFNRWSRNNPRL